MMIDMKKMTEGDLNTTTMKKKKEDTEDPIMTMKRKKKTMSVGDIEAEMR